MTTLPEPELSKSLSAEKNRFIENSCAHPQAALLATTSASRRGGRPCWSLSPDLTGLTLWYHILGGVKDCKGGNRGSQCLSKAWWEVAVRAVSRQVMGVWEGGRGICPSISGSRGAYSAGLASAPSALPSTSSSEQSPVPFRAIRRGTTNGRSPRLNLFFRELTSRFMASAVSVASSSSR